MDLEGRLRELETRASAKRPRHFHYIWRDAAGEVVQLVCSMGAGCDAGVENRPAEDSCQPGIPRQRE